MDRGFIVSCLLLVSVFPGMKVLLCVYPVSKVPALFGTTRSLDSASWAEFCAVAIAVENAVTTTIITATNNSPLEFMR